MNMEKLLQALSHYDDAMDHMGTCGDGYCVIKRPKGMHTNGSCHCYEDRNRARRAMSHGSFLRIRIQEALDS